jgi:ABC-2 type transport system ATP-binding protein
MTIKARLLSKTFGSNKAVVDLSLTVNHGEIVGLLGANGAGKSTLIRMLTGTLAPDSGDAEVNGHSVVTDRIRAQTQIGYLPESAGGFDELHVLEFLRFVANAKGLFSLEADKAIDRIVDALSLAEALTTQLGQLSKGWRQRAWVAQALLTDPPVLFLDEPTDGLDPIQKSSIRAFLMEMAVSKTILMSTHILEEAELLCKKVIIMDHGQILETGPTDEFLCENGRLEPKVKMLLGVSDEKIPVDG